MVSGTRVGISFVSAVKFPGEWRGSYELPATRLKVAVSIAALFSKAKPRKIFGSSLKSIKLRSELVLVDRSVCHQWREYKSPYDWCQLKYHHGKQTDTKETVACHTFAVEVESKWMRQKGILA
jgi:hypothetical protein